MKSQQISLKQIFSRSLLSLVSGVSVLSLALPAFAHHPLGGTTPTNALQGFLSGLGHPVIGLDHLMFVIVVGLLATRFQSGWAVVAAFLVGGLAGTGIHLAAFDLPATELSISLSVLLFGLLAAYSGKLNRTSVALLGAIAGIFHGYAYGEAIVGAQMTPLISYLIGFTSIQALISATAFGIAKRQLSAAKGSPLVRYMGLIACGLGGGFIFSLITG